MHNANYPTAILANYNGDTAKAYEFLAKQYERLEQQHADSVTSRFIEIGRFEAEDPIYCHKKTEEQISRDVDMADCQDEGVMRKWFHVDDAGEIHPVSLGNQHRFSNGVEQPFHFAESAIVANGKCVGHVTYTDH